MSHDTHANRIGNQIARLSIPPRATKKEPWHTLTEAGLQLVCAFGNRFVVLCVCFVRGASMLVL